MSDVSDHAGRRRTNYARGPSGFRDGRVMGKGKNKSCCSRCQIGKCLECKGTVIIPHLGTQPCACRHPDMKRLLKQQAALENLDPNL